MEKMPRHPVPLNPGFLPPATHGVLKSLLENPMKLPLHHEGEVGVRRRLCVRVCGPVPGSGLRAGPRAPGVTAGAQAAVDAAPRTGSVPRAETFHSGRPVRVPSVGRETPVPRVEMSNDAWECCWRLSHDKDKKWTSFNI